MSNTNEIFTVTLINEAKGLNKTIQVTKDEYILDIAEEEDIDMPYSCRTGSCFDCLGKVVEGEVEQTAQALNFLKSDEIKAGYILTCTASPKSNCTILTHQEEKFFS